MNTIMDQISDILDSAWRNGPPCPRCRYWGVTVRVCLATPWNRAGELRPFPGGIYNGLCFCYAPEMHNDFSCFEEKRP